MQTTNLEKAAGTAMGRRNFLRGALAGTALGLGGCRTLIGEDRPELRFGVVSDIHVTTPASVALFEASLLYFRSRGVDAVMVPGDITDWGTCGSLQLVADAWNRVFPKSSGVVPLFCTGNHDYEGWVYDDMAMEMHANGISEDEALVKHDLKACWERIFDEPWAPVRARTVKGYTFVSGEWKGYARLGDWLKEHGEALRGEKPFFYFQHPPLKGTTSDSFGWADNGTGLAALKDFPNAIAFSGHAHHTFNDERSIWQGAFTAIATPSLSYMGVPKDCENGSGNRDGSCTKAMPSVPARRDLRGGQGFVVNVYRDRVEIERRDLEEGGAEGAPAWVVPLPAGQKKPYDPETRAQAAAAPEFPFAAKLETYTRNTQTRQGKWAIVMTLRFPSAVPPKGQRVRDYEVRVEPLDGGEPLVRHFVSPAFHKLARFEPAEQTFWFNAAELPQDRDYVMKVMPRNWYGTCGRPLVSETWHGKPGFDKVKR